MVEVAACAARTATPLCVKIRSTLRVTGGLPQDQVTIIPAVTGSDATLLAPLAAEKTRYRDPI